GMKITVLAEPRILDEIRCVDDQSVLLPMSYAISIICGIRPWVVLPAVGWNDAVGITRNVFVKEDHLIRELDNLARRANARNAWFRAVEYGVNLAFIRFKVFNLFPKFRFVRRSLCPRQRSRHVRDIVPRALIDTRADDLTVYTFGQPDGRQVDSKRPRSAQIRITIRSAVGFSRRL